jgi:hypothetical protein
MLTHVADAFVGAVAGACGGEYYEGNSVGKDSPVPSANHIMTNTTP